MSELGGRAPFYSYRRLCQVTMRLSSTLALAYYSGGLCTVIKFFAVGLSLTQGGCELLGA